MLKEHIAILKALVEGRRLTKNTAGFLQWDDGLRRPPLKNSTTSALFQADLIEPEYKSQLHMVENATGYVVLTQAGKAFIENLNKNKQKYGIGKNSYA